MTNSNEQENPETSTAVAGLLDALVIPHGGYKCIVADPPWQYGKWGKASIPRSKSHVPQDHDMPYETMSVDEIAGMRVAKLAADDCDLYLWTTGNTYLQRLR